MFKWLLVLSQIVLLLGCANGKHKNNNAHEHLELCKKLELPEQADKPNQDYIVPSITPKNKKIIQNPLPPDLSA